MRTEKTTTHRDRTRDRGGVKATRKAQRLAKAAARGEFLSKGASRRAKWEG